MWQSEFGACRIFLKSFSRGKRRKEMLCCPKSTVTENDITHTLWFNVRSLSCFRYVILGYLRLQSLLHATFYSEIWNCGFLSSSHSDVYDLIKGLHNLYNIKNYNRSGFCQKQMNKTYRACFSFLYYNTSIGLDFNYCVDFSNVYWCLNCLPFSELPSDNEWGLLPKLFAEK